LGSLSVKHAMFGQASTILLRPDIQGVLGLGPSAASPSVIESHVVTAFKHGLIAQPVATVLLTTRCETPAMTFGGTDDANCGPLEAWHDISVSSDACKQA
ncbi:hypothetical protein AAVH_21141, partial [Aphelenchoides avenae]